ncbi:MAG: CRISPR-associated helicase Cas3' [Caldilineaceae bacterium]
MAKREGEYKRLELLYKMLVHYLDRAYSDLDLGAELGTDRSNIWRIRGIMAHELEIPIQESVEEPGKYFIRKDFQMRYIHFSPQEMAALYLAARRLQQQTKTSQEHVGLALKKLANAMQKSLAESLVKAAGVVLSQEQDAQQEKVFSDLVESWLNNIPVRIYHTKLHGARRDYVVHPYQIEPSVWGDGNYLIGYSEYHKKIARFKLARIDKVVPTGGPFRENADFNVHEFLNQAWGIWSTEDDPVTVKLRFKKWIVPLVQETIWHPNAVLHKPAEDGSRIWEVQVAEWREMEPWIKGWGSNVEVLEPIELRERLIAEAGRLAKLYATETPPPKHRLFWAKTDSEDRTHPLICHLIDVGQVALALWNSVLTAGFRAQVADALGLEQAEAGRLFAFWCAIHDIGKASPNFQRKFEPGKLLLERASFTFPPVFGKNVCYHATISALILQAQLVEGTHLDSAIAWEVAQALGGHHGSWPTSEIRHQHEAQIGDGQWQQAQRMLLREVIDLFDPPTVQRLGRNDTERGATLVLLSGLTSVADWMGSMSEYFPFSTPHVAPELYMQLAARRAVRVLNALGWTDWQPPSARFSFEALHGFPPRLAQQAVIDLAPGDEEPTLLIAELPTGCGKTELALYLADRWAVERQQRGLYVAMPTQATSNQMWDRVGRFLRRRYPQDKINYHLIHGNAQWKDDLPELAFATNDDTLFGVITAQSWFLPRKRTLLAPFAVGTVDQALLSTLQTRHFFVRLFGLSRKTIIFDEVHAYDAYMNALFQRLLVWLHAVGASVIILSATLPSATRRQLVKAWRGTDEDLDKLSGGYPAVTVAGIHTLYSKELPADAPRTVKLNWIGHTTDAIVAALQERFQSGGCVAIICNRVRRAQEIYQALESAHLVPEEDLLLFHARTPGIWRNATEAEVLARFGKETAERKPAVIVATQVIEQSLDLDFDLIISDLAPLDLLLQRAGRLHRHVRASRPQAMAEPTLLVTTPKEKPDGAPDWDGDDNVYEPYILLRSLLTLQGAGHKLTLPEQTVALIEAVYGGTERPGNLPPHWEPAFAKALQAMLDNQRRAEVEANKRLVAAPDYEDLLLLRNDLLAEEDDEVHQSLQALTRLIQPSVSLVCLYQVADGLALDPGGPPEVDLKTKPTHDQTKELAQRVVTVTHPAVRRYFVNQSTPPGWREHTLLHTHRAAIFVDGECRLEGINVRLRLSRRLGLEIINEKSTASSDSDPE